MKLHISIERDRKNIIAALYKILKNNTLLTLSTIDGVQPYSNTAYYVYDKAYNIYIWTGTATRHSRNIAKNPLVAINIFDSAQPWGSLLQGIQARGKASKATTTELIKAGALYIKQYPKVMKLVKHPRDFHSKVFESRLYKISLEHIKLFDEKTFGKEEYLEVRIER